MCYVHVQKLIPLCSKKSVIDLIVLQCNDEYFCITGSNSYCFVFCFTGSSSWSEIFLQLKP